MAGKANHRGFGNVRKLPSGNWQASYVGPDGARHTGPVTWKAKLDAEGWLAQERTLIGGGTWVAPKARAAAIEAAKPRTFGDYAEAWVRDRTLKPRTRAHYKSLLAGPLAPWADVPLPTIRPDRVREWYASLDPERATLRSHAYGLLRTILGEALKDDLIAANPCHIRGAGSAKRRHQTKPATLDELAVIVEAMPERYRLMVLLASWCAMRFGELAELRRTDVDTKAGLVHVRRGVVRVDGGTLVGTPKSDAGIRTVTVPPHLLPLLREHLLQHCQPGKDGLLFPSASGGHLAPSAFYGRGAEFNDDGSVKRAGRGWYAARQAAGRDDLRFHDLRHTGAVLAAQTGATLAELMRRLGHSTAGAAMRYQHASDNRDLVIAAKLSALLNPAQG